MIYTTRDGQGIGYCQDYFREAVARGDASNYEYCSTDTVFGRRLPEGHQSHVGAIQLGSIKPADFLAALKPDLWLTVGVGGVAMILLFVFARATGTLRGGLAVSIASVFLGLLLFPTAITARIPGDMRAQLVTAFQWIVVFYFGSEAAVQAWKISHRDGSNITGDMPDHQSPIDQAD